MMYGTCEACDTHTKIYNGLCKRCEFSYYSGIEERSVTMQAMISRQFPKDMSDPWDMVEA